MHVCHRSCNCIVPPHLLRHLMNHENGTVRDAALSTLLSTERLRGKRTLRSLLSLPTAPAGGHRTIFDMSGGTNIGAAKQMRGETGGPAKDPSVNRAFDGFGKTRDFYLKVLGRNSTDGKGAPLNGFIHRGYHFNNAFWDGQEMIFGDGDGVIFTDLTKSLDVIAHELTHGVTEFSAGLEYHNQSGALNESISDVFGSLVKQWSLGQRADKADWLIGKDVLTPQVDGDALRSLKAPGTAYNNSAMGRDPQPDHMQKYVQLPDTEDGDNGGVHINSGIPNKAFYLTATGIGGHAWEAPGHIWYESLLASGSNTQFQDFADTSFAKAGQLYGQSSKEQKAVQAAWQEVGIRVRVAGAPPGAVASERKAAENFASLTRKIDELSQQVASLTGGLRVSKRKK